MIPKDLKQYGDFFTEYTELRAQENKSNQIAIINGDIITNRKQVKSGISARVYKDDHWGFASNPLLTENEIRNVIERATGNALFLSGKGKKKDLTLPVSNGNLRNDFSTQNALKSQSEIIEFLMKPMRRLEPTATPNLVPGRLWTVWGVTMLRLFMYPAQQFMLQLRKVWPYARIPIPSFRIIPTD